MQLKLNKIFNLEQQGNTIKKVNRFGNVLLKDQSGRQKIIFGLPGKKSPVGFSWIAFFFAPFVYAQIKEWSYFYAICIITLATSIIEGAQTLTTWEALRSISTILTIASFLMILASWAVAIYFGYSYPYHRNLQLKNQTVECNRAGSIISGTIAYIIALVPSLVVKLFTRIMEGILISPQSFS